MAQKYQPPKQGLVGQCIDAAIILVLVLLALFIPLELELAGAEGRLAARAPHDRTGRRRRHDPEKRQRPGEDHRGRREK